MDKGRIAQSVREGACVLGIELGSTRIKAVLIDERHAPVASGAHTWENRLENGVWTYALPDVWAGVQDTYAQLARNVAQTYGERLTALRAVGFSAMMHGYLPFDREGKQLAGFRTWRNTTTAQATAQLTRLFHFNIPQRWSVAHLYQAILDGEAHVADIDFLTTLAGYVHWRLTGRRVLGIGDASGMFPIDSRTGDYDARMLEAFDGAIANKGYAWKLRDILPRVLAAGEEAGCLTREGALLLDPSGLLAPGAVLCPPEGDAGTGMAATNSVAERTGNVSTGTSVFAMAVLEKPLKRVHEEIDLVTTPTGKPVAMVHCNNCTSDLNAWVKMLRGFGEAMGQPWDEALIFPALFQAALRGDADCGGVVSYNYLSGEPVVGLAEGRPLLVRLPDADFRFENLARALVLGAVATLKLGMDILFEQEDVRIDALLGHGGLFKTPGVAQRLLAAALETPVSVMETAGEGGPWGMALLAAFAVRGDAAQTLEAYLRERVFAACACETVAPDARDVAGFQVYLERYVAAMAAERAAAEHLPQS